jgi:TetR/AcrR family transcriptional regulator, repressor for uid operon
MARSADPVLAQRRRRQILDAAMACFRRRGFHQTSMQEICAEADLSAGALYRYFPSKSEIIAAIAEEDRTDAEPLFEAIASGANMIEGLCAFAEHVVAKCGAESTIAADLIAETLRDTELSQRFATHETTMRAKLAVAIAAAQRRGRAALNVSPEQAARIIVLMLDGLVIRSAARGAADCRPLVSDFRVVMQRLFDVPPAPPAGRRKLANASKETA